MDIVTKDKEYIANTYARFPVVIDHGKSELLYDINGKEYIDMGSGIAVNIFGASDESWKDAVISQLNKIQHTSNLYYTKPCTDLAEVLCKRTGMKKVFFSNSGAEANECASKAARKYGSEKKGADYYNIITLENSFHGRTITTLAATGQEKLHKDYNPLTRGFLYAKAGDIEDIKRIESENKVCAVMIEIIQGEGGVNSLDLDYLKALEAFCKEKDILLIIDEVQSGNGRIGYLYSYMSCGINPDIVTTAKGLGAGLPIGATLLGEKVADIFTPGTHGSTFGANPVVCAGALNVINRLDDNLLKEVREKSEYIIKELEGADGIEQITGMGLMLGLKVKKDATEIVNECIDKGVLVLKAHEKIRLTPPLNISMANLEKAVNIIKEACKE